MWCIFLGQRINVTLFDYTYEGTIKVSGATIPSSTCQHKFEYMFLKEGTDQSESVRVCAGKYRKREVYLTGGNKLEVILASQAQRKTGGHFMLQYEGRMIHHIVTTQTISSISDYFLYPCTALFI